MKTAIEELITLCAACAFMMPWFAVTTGVEVVSLLGTTVRDEVSVPSVYASSYASVRTEVTSNGTTIVRDVVATSTENAHASVSIHTGTVQNQVAEVSYQEIDSAEKKRVILEQLLAKLRELITMLQSVQP